MGTIGMMETPPVEMWVVPPHDRTVVPRVPAHHRR